MMCVVDLVPEGRLSLRVRSQVVTPPNATPFTLIAFEFTLGNGEFSLIVPEQVAQGMASKVRELESKLVAPNAKN